MILGKELFYAGLSVLVFIGENALAYKTGCSGGYCFVVSENKVDEVATQQEAQQWCLSNGSQLVEIINPDIQYSLVNFTQNQALGGVTYITNGDRTSGNWTRLSGRNIGNISINGPTDPSSVYGYLRPSNYGFDIYASRSTSFIEGYFCSGVSNCTNGFIINGQCYKVYEDYSFSLSWYGARNRCFDAGGDLASFDFIDSNAGFNALNYSWIDMYPFGYWIGFRREWWTWQSSKKDVSYSFWYSNYPTNVDNCLCLSQRQLQWINCDCNQQYQFICILGTNSADGVISHSIVSASYEAYTTLSTNQTAGNIKSPSTEAKTGIGIGVGIGVGGFLIIVVVVVVVIIIIMKKRDRKKLSRTKMTSTRSQNATTSANRNVESPTDNRGPSSAVASAEKHYEALKQTTPQQDHDYQQIQHSVNPDYEHI